MPSALPNPKPTPNPLFGRNEYCWLLLLAFMLVCLSFRSQASWLIVYPAEWVAPIGMVLNLAMDWFINTTGWFFRGLSAILDIPVRAAQNFLHYLPWPVVMVLTVVASYAAAGWKLAIFSTAALLYMVVVGYWPESMNSLSLVVISVPLAIAVGFAFGIWGFFSPRAERWIMPSLDMLQTIPAFAYLLPILLLFGFGPVVGLIASLLFSFPPMVRNTILGLRLVSVEVVESGLMSGASASQLFWQVRVPTASRQLLLGVNQTTMASVSMVIIASIIGGTADIGWEVLSNIRKAQFGESVLAGIVIALLAMVIDRITVGLATRETNTTSDDHGVLVRYRFFLIGLIGAAVFFVAAEFLPFFRQWPKAWVFYPAEAMNNALANFILEWKVVIEKFKNFTFFYLMLPTRIGLEGTVSPYTWGFELTKIHQFGYGLSAIALTLCAVWRRRIGIAITICFLAILFYFGLTKLPWIALIGMATLLGWQLNGKLLAIGTGSALLFLAVAGVWPEAMLSIYLCGIAVAISFFIGASIGILASEVEWFSRIVRPINDTLQTMPLFVILIPFVMIFKIGEFSALLAIIAYAIVPSIRYTEHGLRNLPADVIEAAVCMGCTRRQLLWQVKLPLALPVLMLGLNQTIMYGIAMLVIAALVGTNGLGQQVYIGLGDGDFGIGMVAGFGMAIIAMISDRFTHNWSKSRRRAFGLE